MPSTPYDSPSAIPRGVYTTDENAQPLPMLAQVPMGATRAALLRDDLAYEAMKATI